MLVDLCHLVTCLSLRLCVGGSVSSGDVSVPAFVCTVAVVSGCVICDSGLLLCGMCRTFE